MRTQIISLLLSSFFILIGCMPTTGNPVPTATIKPYPALGKPILMDPTVTPTAGNTTLTAGQLNNARYTTYLLDGSGKTYQLSNGRYQDGAGAEYTSVALLDPIAFGDLNHDGAWDAAVLLSENYGGSGVFVSLITMVNQGGAPVQTAITAVDDRPVIKTLKITNDELVLDAVVHGFNDPGCCPSFSVSRTYTLVRDRLILTRQTSLAPDGQERSIQITTSAAEAPVTGAIHVQGKVSLTPTQGNLTYRLYDPMNQLLHEGIFSIAAAEPGAPGTFDISIPLLAANPGLRIRVEILDIDITDGSTLAMDSIEMLVE